tara:strand:+ start:45 stop:578 length:534 start_codon:yes stop_codon:yes gene_type:complete
MIRNFIYVQDGFLSETECDEVINFFKKLPLQYYEQGSYNGIFLNDDSPYLRDRKLSFLKGRFQSALNKYVQDYPELNYVEPFSLKEIRFKHWKKNKFFDFWHSEHSSRFSNRILNFMIYLSTHDCGTEFLDKSVIKSEKGRLAMFPSYFTHTHRGMPCPEKKDRYMFGGYFNFDKLN